MHEDRPAFGQRLAELAELGVIEFRPEPLDAIVERRLKTIWEQRSCPNCSADSLQALDGSDRIWCGRCDWKTTNTRGTPFYDSELTGGEFLIAFILYADTLLSITQIAALLSLCYTTLYTQLREFETAFYRGAPTVWERISQTVDGPSQVDETQQVCSGFKGQEPRGRGSIVVVRRRGGRTRWTGEQGDEVTLVAACRDVLRVVSAHDGSDYDDDLDPVIEEADDHSQPLGEVWTDGLPAYRGMEHDHRYVVHDEEYVSEDGVHTNQVECLWSLLQPWVAPQPLQAGLGAGRSYLRVPPLTEPYQGTDSRPRRLHRCQCVPLDYRRACDLHRWTAVHLLQFLVLSRPAFHLSVRSASSSVARRRRDQRLGCLVRTTVPLFQPDLHRTGDTDRSARRNGSAPLWDRSTEDAHRG